MTLETSLCRFLFTTLEKREWGTVFVCVLGGGGASLGQAAQEDAEGRNWYDPLPTWGVWARQCYGTGGRGSRGGFGGFPTIRQYKEGQDIRVHLLLVWSAATRLGVMGTSNVPGAGARASGTLPVARAGE